MSTTDKKEFDYQAYMKGNSPDRSKVHRGTDARKRRFEKTIMKDNVRIAEDILEEFRQFTPQGEEYEKLINQALREWLSAKNMKELIRSELQQMVQQAFASAQAARQVTR
jgi:uncharacterized protein (DUF4415 family)